MKEDCTSFVLERTFTFSNTRKDEIKERGSKIYSLYLILLNQVLLVTTSLSVRMLRTHSILYSLLFSTLLGSCSYHISVCMNPSFEHNFQWITLPRLSFFFLYSFSVRMLQPVTIWVTLTPSFAQSPLRICLSFVNLGYYPISPL